MDLLLLEFMSSYVESFKAAQSPVGLIEFGNELFNVIRASHQTVLSTFPKATRNTNYFVWSLLNDLNEF